LPSLTGQDFDEKLTVLFVGQYSTGKTSIKKVNNKLGTIVQFSYQAIIFIFFFY